jgi:hypothetical protein
MFRFVNTTETPQLRGSKIIQPGDSRVIDKVDVLPTDVTEGFHVYPAMLGIATSDTESAAVDLTTILTGNVGEVKAVLLGLDDLALIEIEKLEQQGGKRQGVLGAIAQLRVERAETAKQLEDDLINGLPDKNDDELAELAILHADNQTLVAAIGAEQDKRTSG